GSSAVQCVGGVECGDAPTDRRDQHHGRQHRDDERTVAEDCRVESDRSDHAGVGQRPLSTQRRGQGIGQSVGYHAVVPPPLTRPTEPDRTPGEVHQTSCPLRPLPSEVCRLSSRHPRNPRRHSDHVRRATGDADDAQLSAIRRCFTHGRVRYKWEEGREIALVGIFKTRFLERLESSIESFRLSLRRALTFEETYLDYLLDGKLVTSRDFQKVIRFLARDEEDDLTAGSLADELDAVDEAKAYLDSLPKVDRNEYDLRRLRHDVEADVKTLRDLHDRTAEIGERDGKLARLKELLSGDLKGKKVLIFSTFKDTSRYLYRKLTTESNAGWLKSAGDPHIRRIDSGNHPSERPHMLGLFAPVANE